MPVVRKKHPSRQEEPVLLPPSLTRAKISKSPSSNLPRVRRRLHVTKKTGPKARAGAGATYAKTSPKAAELQNNSALCNSSRGSTRSRDRFWKKWAGQVRPALEIK